MTIREYAEQIASKIPGAKAKEIIRNNQYKSFGVLIPVTENIYQTYHVDTFYQNGLTVDEVLRMINNTDPTTQKMIETMENFTSFEENEDKVILVLLNKEKNKDVLDELVYEEFLDLIVVPYLMHDFGHIRLSKRLLDIWGCDKETIFNMAKVNMGKQCVYKSLSDLIFDMCGKAFENSQLDSAMRVITNNIACLGAGYIALPWVQKMIARDIGDYWILPSSINELIVVKRRENDDILELAEMVRAINREYVEPKDFLSDNIYFYNSETQKISIAEVS